MGIAGGNVQHISSEVEQGELVMHLGKSYGPLNSCLDV